MQCSRRSSYTSAIVAHMAKRRGPTGAAHARRSHRPNFEPGRVPRTYIFLDAGDVSGQALRLGCDTAFQRDRVDMVRCPLMPGGFTTRIFYGRLRASGSCRHADFKLLSPPQQGRGNSLDH